MKDWFRLRSAVYRNLRRLWSVTIIDRLNAGLLPQGMIAMAEHIIGGPEPDIVMLQQHAIVFSAEESAAAIMTDAPSIPKRNSL